MSRRRRGRGTRTFGALVLAGAGWEVGRRLGRWIWRAMVCISIVAALGLVAAVAGLAAAVPPEARATASVAVTGVLLIVTICAYYLLKSQWWVLHRRMVGRLAVVLTGVASLLVAVSQARGI